LCPRRPRGRSAAYSWRGCRGNAGHHPCRPAHGERGKRPDAALPSPRPVGWRAGRRRLMASGCGGAPGVVRGQESCLHGEGGSEFAVVGLAGQEATGEYRRTVADALGGRGGGAATGEPDQAAPVGDRRSCTSVRRSGHLICDPALVLVAWRRVRGNKGARTAGVDGGQTARYIERERGEEAVLADVGAELKARRFTPLPVRERQIPKPGGKLRRLGIATIQDRVVQAALKLVLEPIFEADFVPCSYGFRIPVCGRRAFTKYAPGQRSARSGCGAGRLAGARDPPAPPASLPADGRSPESCFESAA
jgi:hypothetical protein